MIGIYRLLKTAALYWGTQWRPNVVAVDFDGVIVHARWPDVGPTRRAVVWLLRKISTHNCLILWTCREEDILHRAASRCLREGLYIEEFNNNHHIRMTLFGGDPRKISADYYIDDRACSCTILWVLQVWLELTIKRWVQR